MKKLNSNSTKATLAGLSAFSAIALGATSAVPTPESPGALVSRPPQFVLISFDANPSDFKMWESTRGFAQELEDAGIPIRFTYFADDSEHARAARDDGHEILDSDGAASVPLTELTLAGSAKRALSIDLSIYLAQSGGAPDPVNASRHEKQVYLTYLKLLESRYAGDRAPIHLHHHFALWNGGIYWNALQAFATDVCGLPEIRCVSHAQHAKHLEDLSAEQLAGQQAGRFERVPPPPAPTRAAEAALEFADETESFQLELGIGSVAQRAVFALPEGRDLQTLLRRGLKLHWEIDGEVVAAQRTINWVKLVEDRSHQHRASQVLSLVASLRGIEIARHTREILGLTLGNVNLETLALARDRLDAPDSK